MQISQKRQLYPRKHLRRILGSLTPSLRDKSGFPHKTTVSIQQIPFLAITPRKLRIKSPEIKQDNAQQLAALFFNCNGFSTSDTCFSDDSKICFKFHSYHYSHCGAPSREYVNICFRIFKLFKILRSTFSSLRQQHLSRSRLKVTNNCL